MKPPSTWCCDVCFAFKSADYDEVVEHEKKCKAADNAKLPGNYAAGKW